MRSGRRLRLTRHAAGHGADVGRKGASKEVEDVELELERMRILENYLERDLAAILSSVRAQSQALVNMESVGAPRGYKQPTVEPTLSSAPP